MKKVSVIIPCYNVEKYVRQCLDSVLAQTCTTIEIIVVNDGSTDKTGDVLEEYAQKDTRIHVIQKENAGLAAARNTGMQVATGEYMVLLDSDDVMLPTKIAQQLVWMEEHPTHEIIYSDLYHFWDGTSKIYRLAIAQISPDVYQGLIHGNFINPNTVCMKRSVYDRIGGFDEALRSAEDWEYWLRAAKSGIVIAYQPEVLTLYRMRSNGLSADRVTMCETALSVLTKQYTYDLPDIEKKTVDTEIAQWNMKLVIAQLQQNKIATSLPKKIWYKILVRGVRIVRGIKLWLRLKRIRNKKIEAYLSPYAK